MMIPDTQRRLEAAHKDLSQLVVRWLSHRSITVMRGVNVVNV
jgi:hypothetical protein